MVGENGSTLSDGEHQRISVARALLKDALIILLDETAASLNVENETPVQEAISKLVKDKALLFISHRMRAATHADQIVALANGKVAKRGTPEKFYQRDGVYTHMVKLQAES